MKFEDLKLGMIVSTEDLITVFNHYIYLDDYVAYMGRYNSIHVRGKIVGIYSKPFGYREGVFEFHQNLENLSL